MSHIETTSIGYFVYYNGESERWREEMRWCRCYEGQRADAWGCQGPSHTGLIIIQLLLYIDSTEEVVNLFEVKLEKPRNLSVSESEERGPGEGVSVYSTLLSIKQMKTYTYFIMDQTVLFRLLL
jgi:hypothetical protein